MGKSRFTEMQIITLLKEVEKGRTVKDVCREYSVGEATYYQWKSKYGGRRLLISASSVSWKMKTGD